MSDQATPALRGVMALMAAMYFVIYIVGDIQQHTFKWLHLLWLLVVPAVWVITWLIFPDYWWWPNHAEERVQRIKDWERGQKP